MKKVWICVPVCARAYEVGDTCVQNIQDFEIPGPSGILYRDKHGGLLELPEASVQTTYVWIIFDVYNS